MIGAARPPHDLGFARVSILLVAVATLALGACGDDDGPAATPDAGVDAAPPPPPPEDGGPDAPDAARPVAERPECEGLNEVHCLFPWPSSRWLVEDPSTATGYRLEIPPAALPRNQFDEPASPDAWRGFDGFSPMTSIITAFAGEVDATDLPDETRVADSLLPGSPTVLLDAETGERLPHFAELDSWPEADPQRRSFYIRPAVRLREDHRYVVALRDLRLTGGSPIEPSETFRALRDDVPSDVASIEARRAAFEGIFSLLAAAGVERGSLIEAWDFRTASRDNALGSLLSMRDDALTRVGERGLGCTVSRVEDDVNDEIWRRVTGTFTVPLYMESAFEGARAHRDAEGRVTFNGMAEAPFTVVIPRSVHDAMAGGAGEPASILVYGHGLLGASDQVGSGGTRTFLQRAGMVGVATDWWGLSEADESVVVLEWIPDIGRFPLIAERLMQGVLNFALLARSFRGVCGDLPELAIDGRRALGEDLYYYGISQGGIMGASLAGISPDIERFALQVGGISYPIMIRRSVDFERFEEIFARWYPDKLDRDWALVASQNGWDLAEPAPMAPHLLADPLPGNTAKRILYQVSRYDTEVSNVASEIAARTMGLPWLRSSVYEPWGVVPAADGPLDSGYVIYHVAGVAPIPVGTAHALEENDAHGQLRFQEPVLEQLQQFLRPDGRVVDTCAGGSCDLE